MSVIHEFKALNARVAMAPRQRRTQTSPPICCSFLNLRQGGITNDIYILAPNVVPCVSLGLMRLNFPLFFFPRTISLHFRAGTQTLPGRKHLYVAGKKKKKIDAAFRKLHNQKEGTQIGRGFSALTNPRLDNLRACL